LCGLVGVGRKRKIVLSGFQLKRRDPGIILSKEVTTLLIGMMDYVILAPRHGLAHWLNPSLSGRFQV